MKAAGTLGPTGASWEEKETNGAEQSIAFIYKGRSDAHFIRIKIFLTQ
jgi:hypothetical protein